VVDSSASTKSASENNGDNGVTEARLSFEKFAVSVRDGLRGQVVNHMCQPMRLGIDETLGVTDNGGVGNGRAPSDKGGEMHVPLLNEQVPMEDRGIISEPLFSGITVRSCRSILDKRAFQDISRKENFSLLLPESTTALRLRRRGGSIGDAATKAIPEKICQVCSDFTFELPYHAPNLHHQSFNRRFTALSVSSYLE
jgi:hypothetical protein